MADLERVREIAAELFAQHLAGQGWTFGFDNARRRAGACHFGSKKITLSRHLAARYDEQEVRQTLLHEIAHAFAGPRAGHGLRWKRAAAAVGYKGGIAHDADLAADTAPWVGACAAGHTFYRYRQPTRITSCAACSPRFDPAHVINWRRRVLRAARSATTNAR